MAQELLPKAFSVSGTIRYMKSMLWLLIALGSIIGGFIPAIFGASAFSLWGLVGSTIGAFVGIYVYTQLDI